MAKVRRNRKRKRSGGRPVSTGSSTTPPVRFRVSADQRAELDAEGARAGISGDLAAKRRVFPDVADMIAAAKTAPTVGSRNWRVDVQEK